MLYYGGTATLFLAKLELLPMGLTFSWLLKYMLLKQGYITLKLIVKGFMLIGSVKTFFFHL